MEDNDEDMELDERDDDELDIDDLLELDERDELPRNRACSRCNRRHRMHGLVVTRGRLALTLVDSVDAATDMRGMTIGCCIRSPANRSEERITAAF